MMPVDRPIAWDAAVKVMAHYLARLADSKFEKGGTTYAHA